MAVSIAAGLVALVLAGAGWFRGRRTFGAGAYVVSALAACFWCWSIAAFDHLNTAGNYPFPVVGLWLASVSTYVSAVYVTARRAVSPRWSPSRVLIGLFVVEPAVILALEVTNPAHELMGTKVDDAIVFGIGYQLHLIYCVVLVLASTVALATRSHHASRAQRRQIMVLRGLVVAVVIVEISQLGVTHYIAVVGLMVLYRSVFVQGINELVPLSRAAAVDQMVDQVFFFDTQGRLVDMNTSARELMRVLEGRVPATGSSFKDVLGSDAPLDEAADLFIVFGKGAEAVETIARCTSLKDGRGEVAGWMVIARDLSSVSPRSSGFAGGDAGIGEVMARRTDQPVQHDPVTGLLTRAQLDHFLRQAVLSSSESGEPLSVALLDIDGFKLINDTYGHLVGDRVLKEIAERVRRAAGTTTTLGRFGGDEFVAVFTGQPIVSASRAAEAMRASVDATPVVSGDAVVAVTVTIGVAEYGGGQLTELVRAADDAMYVGTRAGRNRVRVAEDASR